MDHHQHEEQCMPHESQDERTYHCPLCSKQFSKLTTLKRHVGIHMKTQPVRCGYCGQFFLDLGRLNAHIRQRHTSNKKIYYKCDKCNKTYKSKYKFERHKNTHVTENSEYPCIYCRNMYKKVGLYKEHMKNAHGNKIITRNTTCGICHETHLVRDDIGANLIYICDACQEEMAAQESKTMRKDNKHKIRRRRKKVRRKKFEEQMKNITQEHVNRKCNNTQETLHMILNERKNGMYPNKISGDDPQTNAKFVGGESISNITRHSVLCKNRNIKYLTCFKCNFTTRNIRQYERHCFHSHYSSTFTCPKCQHISNNIFTFVLHRRKHLNSRPYPCHLCGKHFVTVHTLLRHLEIHKSNQTNERFQCRLCTKTFSLKHYRREHEMTHSKKLQLKCKYCFHKTNRRMYMDKHIRMHEMGLLKSNSDRFCETCNIAFQTRQVFVIHVLEKHMQNYTVLVMKKLSTELSTQISNDPRKHKIPTVMFTQPSQFSRKKVKLKKHRNDHNQTGFNHKIKIIKIVKRNFTNTFKV
ncbi:hypothetical protein M8J76_004446 [Diaphorina citri]|nr:hypothetical protein M8J76_004446 [Diaphorina citri]